MSDDPNDKMQPSPMLPPMFPPLDPGGAGPLPPPLPPDPQMAAPTLDASSDIPWHEFATHTLWRYIGTLFMEYDVRGDRVVSVGRTSLVAVLALAFKHWWIGADVPSTMMQALMVLFAYNLGKQGLTTLQALAEMKKQFMPGGQP